MADSTADTTEPAISLTDVTKAFGDITAIRNVDMRVERGEVYGFLGPNGAGKTTTISLLVNFVKPTSGKVRVCGRSPSRGELAVKVRTGILPEGFTPYPELSGRYHVRLACSLRGGGDPDPYLECVGLADEADEKTDTYSRGMTRRLGLAMALVGKPDLLILDEPFAGLDPVGVGRVKEILKAVNAEGTTVFCSSHQLDHVQSICDRVGIINEGRIVAQGPVSSFLHEATEASVIVEPHPVPEQVPDAVLKVNGVSAAEIRDSKIHIDCDGRDVKSAAVVALEEAGTDVVDFYTDQPSLESIFDEVTR